MRSTLTYPLCLGFTDDENVSTTPYSHTLRPVVVGVLRSPTVLSNFEARRMLGEQ